ncbi:hypothetical protein DCAR_0520095 [Daucus carota subsp. sativus]|uniref:TF-B3 domain-containing protein n=1 Tax=Daucus carota subsp. sativus TaxID=79200 RepID=A0AAF0X6K0_DAUCS|nr:hypothetical protein DCAR_0520095 [Daucus carota subsp. sativus]
MESTGIVADKFCILLTFEDTKSNKLKFPANFMLKYSSLLDDSMEIKLRNGYIQPVQVDKSKCQMKGVKWFFNTLELKGGELLVFEYFGRSRINLYIIGSNGTEIRYPDRVHILQRCSPGIVTLADGGWRFVTTRSDLDAVIDYIDPPAAFIDRCGFALPKRIIYLLSNGKKFVGSYDSETCRFSGLKSMFDIVGLDVIHGVRTFLFTYDGTERIVISAFDSQYNEIVFQGTPLCMGK